MNKLYFLQLLTKYREGTASEEEITFLITYYNLFDYKDNTIDSWPDSDFELLEEQIKENINTRMSAVERPYRNTIFFKRLFAAASLIIVASATIFLCLRSPNNRLVAYKGPKLTIRPGLNQVVLVLANGKKVDLNNALNGSIAQQGNTRIFKSKNGEIVYDAAGIQTNDTAYNTINTPRGGTFVVVLPDNSRAYLNAQSSIRFPVNFKAKVREVSLTGEAYFEVAHDKNRPFRVSSGMQTVNVLGTHFDVKAYADEHMIQTTLLEGKVSVTSKETMALLLPNQRADNSDGKIKTIKNIDAEEAVAWKKGMFHFEKADIREVLREFARWYDVQVIYDSPAKGRLFSGDIHKDLNLEQALELLNYENVHFIIDGRKVIVTP